MRRLVLVAVFVGVLLAVLVGGHLYLAQRLVWRPALPAPWRDLALGLLAAGALSLLLQPIAERTLPRRLGRLIAWPASLWMGAAFFLLVGALLSDGLGALMGAVTPGVAAPETAARAQAMLITALAVVALWRGSRELRQGPRLTRVTVRIARWPAALDGFRIVQISDLHIGPILDRRFAAALTEQVNALAPDLVAITGDLVDGDVRHVGDEIAPFAGLRAAHGVFFVTGNHDYYSGADAWVGRVTALGLRPLRNQRVSIGDGAAGFDLAGVEDHRAHLVSATRRSDLGAALAGRDPDRPLVLLAHDPLTFKEAARRGVDLQLSGHTHGGQIWPFRYLVRLSTPFVAGYYRRGRSQLYVSRGTGFWGPALRLFAPAEIVELTIRGARWP
ncbi:metallophosphoesterase [bacterium]|nr:metallophosphoesterase [bacterium]